MGVVWIQLQDQHRSAKCDRDSLDDLGRLVIRLNPLDGEPTHIVTILGKRPTHDDPIPLSDA